MGNLGGRKYSMSLCVSPFKLSHDVNETLPLDLFVKSFGKNIDSRLRGRWGLEKVG